MKVLKDFLIIALWLGLLFVEVGCGSVSSEKCVCTPGERICSGDDLLVCSPDCKAYKVNHCKEFGSDFTCVNGACVAQNDGDTEELEVRTEESLDEEFYTEEELFYEIEEPETETFYDEEVAVEGESASQENDFYEQDREDYEEFEWASLIGLFAVQINVDFASLIQDISMRLHWYDMMFTSAPCEAMLNAASQEPSLQDFYNLMKNPDGSLTDLGEAFCQITLANLTDLGNGETVPVVAQLEQAFSQLRLLGEYRFLAEPNPNISEEEARFAFSQIQVFWDWGCVPGSNPDCGWITLERNFVSLSRLEGGFSATRDGNNIYLGSHRLSLRASLMINYLLKRKILPSLYNVAFTDDSSYFANIIMRILGGSACSDEDNCCSTFAESLTDAPVLQSNLKRDCPVLISISSVALDNTANNLDLDITDENGIKPLILVSPVGVPCKIYDTDQNGEIDSLGTESAPCQIQVIYHFASGASAGVGSFYGYRE